jgi:hypothetical protein
VSLTRILGCAALGPFWSTLAFAAQAAPAFAPPGAGQNGLAVGSDQSGVLRAAVCAAEPCRVDGGLAIEVPSALRPALTKARLAVVGIGSGRRAIVVTVPGASNGQSFEAVIAVPPGAHAPRVLFQGLTGLVEGSDGVRQGKSVTISDPDESGARRIIVGDQREDLNLCGRPAVLAPSIVNPDDLSLRPAKIQRLSSSEREKAPRLTAAPVAAGEPTAPGGALRSLGASSAIGNPSALTDGNLGTSWAENRGGSGRGEFAVLSAPAELPIAAFDLVVLATGAPARDVPRELWLATRTELFSVTLPADASKTAGQRYRVKLPNPVATDCVALVIESAFEEKPESKVGVLELAAVTEFEGQSPETLVAALAGGAQRARAAGAALRALGGAGYAALAKGFDKLDAGGRHVALGVIDSAPCEVSAPLYVRALGSGIEGQVLHARDRIQRCGDASAGPLLAAARAAKGEALAVYGAELVTVAPGRALDALTPRLARAPSRERRVLRVLLARAASDPEADATVRRLLSDAALPATAAIDLLRALGARITAFGSEARAAFARLGADTEFRTRYLLLGPAAALANSDPAAKDVLLRALAAGKEPWIRVHALEVAPRQAAYTPAFRAALSDEHVRVREAAARALGDGRFAESSADLARLLENDAWPVARRAAASSLGVLPDDPASRAVLLEALDDDAPWVRAAAAESLGLRRSPGAAPKLRDKLDNREEPVEVRRAAALSLGALCDAESVELLDKLARRIADPMAKPEDRATGEAALYALVRIRPADLERRLAPIAKTPAAAGTVQRARARAGSGCTRR